MRIDVHAHAFHPRIASKVVGHLKSEYGIDSSGDGTIANLLSGMKEAGLDRVVVHSAATVPSQVIPVNNWAIHLQKTYPEIEAFGSIHPEFGHIEKELDRLQSNEVRGLKLHPDFQGFSMDDSRFYKLMEIIDGRFMLLFHVGSPCDLDNAPSSPTKTAALRRLFPKPVIIAAHFGGYRYWECALEEMKELDVFVDTSSLSPFLDREYFLKFLDTYDQEHILFGSDYPVYTSHGERDRLAGKMGLSEARIDALMNNASRLFATPDR